MVDVEAEVNKHKTCRDKAELEKRIQEYKGLAFKYASDIYLAGQYNMVVHKLQEICNKLPDPRLKNVASHGGGSQTKTAKISTAEKARINADWKKKAGK